MTDLSPAAQAVFDAAWTCPIVLGDHPTTRSRQIAAALRAAADQLGYSNVPEEFAHLRPFIIDTDDLLVIADELEGIQYGTYRCDLEE